MAFLQSQANSSFLFFIQLGIRPLLGHKVLLVLQVSQAHKVHLAHRAIEMTSVQTSRSTFKVGRNIYYNRNSSKSLVFFFLCNHTSTSPHCPVQGVSFRGPPGPPGPPGPEGPPGQIHELVSYAEHGNRERLKAEQQEFVKSEF